MSGVTPLVDTLLATRLGQRVDLVPLKAQVEIAGPGAVTDVEKVINDVRLPSREALLRQLGPGIVPDDAEGAQAFLGGKADKVVTLSNAARVVSAILNLPSGSTPAVRGTVALWPDAQAPAVSALAATLARTVSGSGLFYESHLHQFAAGTRTLAQMAQEPQAGLRSAAVKPPTRTPAPTLVAADLAEAGSKTAGGTSRPDVLLPALPQVSSEPADLTAGEGGEPLSMIQSADTEPLAEETGTEAVIRKAAHAAENTSPLPTGRSAALEPEGLAAYARAGQPEIKVHRFDEPAAQELVPENFEATASEASGAGDPAAAVHPESVALVRQQLEMLAQPTFRWSGEGWPGVPMEWEIHEERDGQQDQAEDGDGALQEPDSTWVTRLAMQLPRLGAVDMRLSLTDTALHLHLAAVEAATVAQFNAVRDELPRRFDALGLQLAELKISQPVAGSAAPELEEHDDAA